jgi:predicted nucleic acid-binding Zn ribbon protein
VKRPPRRAPEALASLLPSVLRELGFDEMARVLRIAERWEEALGPELARHCRPEALRGEVLEARVASSVWCQQLQLRTPEILEGLRRVLGDDAPSKLWLRVG